MTKSKVDQTGACWPGGYRRPFSSEPHIKGQKVFYRKAMGHGWEEFLHGETQL